MRLNVGIYFCTTRQSLVTPPFVDLHLNKTLGMHSLAGIVSCRIPAMMLSARTMELCPGIVYVLPIGTQRDMEVFNRAKARIARVRIMSTLT